MLDMVRREMRPAVVGYTDRLVRSLLRKREAQLPCACEERLSKKLSALSDGIDQTAGQLDEAELLVAKDVWPYPSYGEMLFSVM